MAKSRCVDKRHKVGSGGGAPAIIRRLVLAAVQRGRLRGGLIPCVERRGATGQGLFREVRLAGIPPEAPRGLCAVLPGGLRIEGLDVAGAAALARLLG